MKTTCTLCQASLEIEESGGAVFCPKCDRKSQNRQKQTLGDMLDNIKESIKKMRQGGDFDFVDEVTIQYHCIKCERPTNQYGWCLWCEDELRETL